MNSKQLIVNADDFGRTADINAGIEIAFREGILSSTTAVANSPALETGLEILRRNPGLGVGVHLTINEYAPLLDHPFLHVLRGKSHLQLLMALAKATTEDLKAVEHEWRLQVSRVLGLGIVPTHFDGHGHCHLQPKLVPIVCRLAQEFGVHRARMPREAFLWPGPAARTAQRWMLNAMCISGARQMRRSLRSPENFFGFTEGGRLSPDALRRIVTKTPAGLSELMCHVGTAEDDPPYHIGYGWRHELQTITGYTKQQLHHEFGIEVISYAEVMS